MEPKPNAQDDAMPDDLFDLPQGPVQTPRGDEQTLRRLMTAIISHNPDLDGEFFLRREVLDYIQEATATPSQQAYRRRRVKTLFEAAELVRRSRPQEN